MEVAAGMAGMSPEAYLAFERASPERHEYVDGALVTRSGGSREHSLVGANVAGELQRALLDRPCEVHGSDMRVKAVATGRYFYPDSVVTCAEPRFEDEEHDTLLNPKVIVEVLSPSTERYDRGDKFASYRTITSLQDYLLFSRTEPLVEHYSRQADGSWVYRTYGPGDRLALPSVGCEVEVARAYHKVFRNPAA